MDETPPTPSLPPGFSIRAPRVDDAADVAALINVRSEIDGVPSSSSADDILLYWEAPDRNLHDEDWLVIAGDGSIVGFLQLYEYEPFTTFEFDCHVHPDYAGIGIEPVLYDIIERRARREMHRAGAGERVVLHTFAASTATDIHHRLESDGFVHIRDGLQMIADLDGIHDPHLPEGITIRPLVRGQDERAFWETAEAAWTDHWGYAPTPYEEFYYYRVEAAKDFDPTLWHLAWDNDILAGVALCLPERTGFDDTGWVSLLGVRREYRGRGIGQALLEHVFVDFKRRGYKQVGLGVDASSLTGADRLYRRAGMREISREFTFEKVLRDPAIPSDADSKSE